MGRGWDDGGALRWLFLDFNSFFASVEQHLRPELRGKPLIVMPAETEHTYAIAVDRLAKQAGVKRGTSMAEARRRRPDVQAVLARPNEYVRMHHQLKAVIERVVPISRTLSIDEVACRLEGPDRLESNARALAVRLKAALREVGPCLTASIGLAPTRLLAKLACDMEKPDGLTVLRKDRLPDAIEHLALDMFSGVGSRMTKRLDRVGIRTVRQLWALSPKRMREIWGSVEGDRFWYGLHGEDAPEPPPHNKVQMGHAHVLAPENRTLDKARQVARILIDRAAWRLRREGFKAGALSLTLDRTDDWLGSIDASFPHTSDTFALLKVLDAIWPEAEDALGGRRARVRYVGCDLHQLRPAEAEPDLFGWTPEAAEDPRGRRLSQTLDALERRFGRDAVTIGWRSPDMPDFIGQKIAFHRVPELTVKKGEGARLAHKRATGSPRSFSPSRAARSAGEAP